MPSKEHLEGLRKEYGIDLEQMVREIKRYLPNFNQAKFKEAFLFAAKAHEGQFRKENKPYIVHPIETVRILTSMHADEDTLIAALMHDVPEDTTHTIAEIEAKFGKKVAFLVDGITKLSKVHFRSDMAQRQIESLKKLFIHSAEDPRIILIKLADRLHNMRTLQYLDKPEKQQRIARETLEIFVPIANLLGIEELKSELEDLCFRYLYPNEYESLAERMKEIREKNSAVFEETIELAQKKMDEAGIKAAVYGRQKNLYTIYKKFLSQGRRADELEDIIALRVLVPDRDDCYKVLGILHSLFKPKPSKFKDYIAVPKVNGYQSLHTTVFGLHGVITEFQVRTHQMHLEAEYGIAAHYFYKQKNKKAELEKDPRSYWVEKILQMQKAESVSDSFLDDLKLDILQDRIFVFTPRGDPIDLPKDASCIDFAYSIHSEIGHRALKADINGHIVPITTLLQTGDTVRIIVSDDPKEPSREWLSFAKTNIAKNNIREYLKHESREAKIRMGKKLLQKEFDRAGLGMVKNIPGKKINFYLQGLAKTGECKNFDDILMALGDGTLSSLDFVNALYFEKKQETQKRKNVPEPVAEQQPWTTVAIKITTEKNDAEQLQNILRTIAGNCIKIIKMRSYTDLWSRNYVYKIILKVKDFQQMSQLFAHIEQIVGVQRVERLFWKRKLTFVAFSVITFLTWAVHPYILYSSKNFLTSYPLAESLFLYFSLTMLFLMVFSLKRLIHRSFPELRETNALWVMTFVLSIFVLITFFAELFFFQLEFNWLISSFIIVIILSYLALEYIDYRDSFHSSDSK